VSKSTPIDKRLSIEVLFLTMILGTEEKIIVKKIDTDSILQKKYIQAK